MGGKEGQLGISVVAMKFKLRLPICYSVRSQYLLSITGLVIAGLPWTACKDDPKLLILSRLPKLVGYRQVPPCPVHVALKTEPKDSQQQLD